MTTSTTLHNTGSKFDEIDFKNLKTGLSGDNQSPWDLIKILFYGSSGAFCTKTVFSDK